MVRDRNGRDHTFRTRDGDFVVDGKPIALRPPKPAGGGKPAIRSAPRRARSTPAPVPARMARASRIFVEGLHDAELVEKVWGDDLRVEGVVVEYLSGMDDLATFVRGFRPRPEPPARHPARPPDRGHQGARAAAEVAQPRSCSSPGTRTSTSGRP